MKTLLVYECETWQESSRKYRKLSRNTQFWGRESVLWRFPCVVSGPNQRSWLIQLSSPVLNSRTIRCSTLNIGLVMNGGQSQTIPAGARYFSHRFRSLLCFPPRRPPLIRSHRHNNPRNRQRATAVQQRPSATTRVHCRHGLQGYEIRVERLGSRGSSGSSLHYRVWRRPRIRSKASS